MLVRTSSTSATRYEHGISPRMPVYCTVSIATDATSALRVDAATPHPRYLRASTPHGTKSSTLNATCRTAALRSVASSPRPAVSRRMSSRECRGTSSAPDTPCAAHHAARSHDGSGSSVYASSVTT